MSYHTDRDLQCSKVYCRNGDMCIAKDSLKTECICPLVCSDNMDVQCSVYLEEFTNPCELHRYACSIQTNIAVKHEGRCSDPKAQLMTNKMVESTFTPTIACPRGEMLQFAQRFQEWGLIAKEVAESSSPQVLDINSSIENARINGLTSIERREILKFLYETLDNDEDGSLTKDEISPLLAELVNREYCLYGFFVSSDLNRNFSIDEEEWYEAFKLYDALNDVGGRL